MKRGWYNKASEFFKKKFNAKVYRVAVDGGFTCPVRDGTLSLKGCIFCDEIGSRARYVDPEKPIEEQVKEGIEKLSKSYKAEKFIVYFQAYSNTYAPVNKLEELYSRALKVDSRIVGLSVSTRPDLLSENVLSLLEELNKKYFVMVEIGIQSFNYFSLKKSRRFHTPAQNIDAILRAKQHGLHVIAHMILGLMDESEIEVIEGAKILSVLGVDGVKLHNLYVVKGTDLEDLYKRGKVKVYEKPEKFAKLVVRYLENLSPSVVIHRLQGFLRKDLLIAPSWTANKHIIRQLVEKYLYEADSYQGKYYPFKV